VRLPSFRPFKLLRDGKATVAAPPLSLIKIYIEENGEVAVISYTSAKNFFKGKVGTLSPGHKNL